MFYRSLKGKSCQYKATSPLLAYVVMLELHLVSDALICVAFRYFKFYAIMPLSFVNS